ncbi:MAG TPA: hypothetical protein VGB76_05330 [Pyrinomonadaceae bacterium]|jgi:hypothetical protein
MNCQKCKIEIEERNLRRERLSDAATAHLSACASCRVFGEERLALSRLVGGLEKVSAPADFDFRMRARMAAEANAGNATRARWFNFSPAALSWPLAACFALVVSAAFYFQQQQPASVTATPDEAARTAVVIEPPTTSRASSGGATAQSAPVKNVETARVAVAPSLKNPTVVRRRALPARGGEQTTVEAAQIRVRLEESNSVGLLGSPLRHAVNGAAQGEGASIPVQVSTQERPLKVLLQETGGARTISVESVSFGSRDVIGRPATISKASLSTNQGVW